MRNVKKWTIGKNPFIALLAPQTAALAWAAPEALQQIRERRIYEYQFPLPDYPRWFALYHSPAKAILAASKLICEFSEFGKFVISFLLIARKAYRSAKPTNETAPKRQLSPLEIQQGLELWQVLIKASFTDLEDGLSGNPFDPEENRRFCDFTSKYETELGFFMLVYAPCWLIHQESSVALYGKALAGNVEALIKLINIDPLLTGDPSINKVIQEIRLKKVNDYDDIINSARKPLSISKKQIKSSFAAFILAIAKGLNIHLNAAQIRNLLDDFAKDTQGTINDVQITSIEGFDKTIKSKAKQWQELFQKLEKSK